MIKPINKLFKYFDISLYVLVTIGFLFVILSSDIVIGYMSKKLSNSMKRISDKFKQSGFNLVEVEGTANMGFIKFKVNAYDNPKSKDIKDLSWMM